MFVINFEIKVFLIVLEYDFIISIRVLVEKGIMGIF